jgi:2-polyprenyl-3-methyl-5-hydroxy-6-metoxy-1,4-benzoquinol methylase
MKVLVVIASYGEKNQQFLLELLREYRHMAFEVDIVVLSNIPKHLGAGIRVVVGLPDRNPHTLPFGHKRVFGERRDEYDLFIYSEDDIRITERNINAFLEVSAVLPDDEIAGFVHAEIDPSGALYYDPPHAYFHWKPDSVRARNGLIFAAYTNEHSASFLLTKQQLKRAIESDGFLVKPHVGKYDYECTASTDPYTQCGFEKLICLSRLDDFTVRHLPANKYETRPYRRQSEFFLQIEALLSLEEHGRHRDLLFDVETKLPGRKWSKDYYEPPLEEYISLIPDDAHNLLSIGCGWGALEGELVEKGFRVVGVPIDSVIAACCEAKGVEIVYGDFKTTRKLLSNESFDCLLLSNVLHLLDEPLGVLSSYVELIREGGTALVRIPNFAQVTTTWRRIYGHPSYRDLGNYDKSGTRLTGPRDVRRWFRSCHLDVERFEYILPPRAKVVGSVLGHLANPLIGEELIALGRKN